MQRRALFSGIAFEVQRLRYAIDHEVKLYTYFFEAKIIIKLNMLLLMTSKVVLCNFR